MLSRSVPSPSAIQDSSTVSHNVMGQRLGRKGQETRERILTAFERLLTDPADCPVTLSGVAREASVGMSTLYLYFPDLGALVMAGLRRLMLSAKIGFLDTIRTRWADEELGGKCLQFTQEYYDFWKEHGRILHLRNSLADANDPRFLESRHQTTMPMVKLLVQQMDADPEEDYSFAVHFGMVLLTSVERICTVITNPYFPFDDNKAPPPPDHISNLIAAEARLIEVAIRHQRQAAATA